MHTLHELFGYTRQAYYKSIRRNDKGVADDCLIMLHVRQIRELMPRVGTQKLQCMLQKRGVKVSRDRLFGFLRENKMLVRRRKRYSVTTHSKHWMKKYPNLIWGFSFQRPNQLWVSDLTYIPIDGSHAYLSLVTDAFSRKIVGYKLSQTLEAAGTIEALVMAIGNNAGKIDGLIHHSDRGIQYCCKEYVGLLRADEFSISMSEHGDPYENALAERVNGICEKWLNLERFYSFEQAQKRIAEVIWMYNHLRPHLSCAMKTPAQVHETKFNPTIRKVMPNPDSLLNL